MYSPTEVHEQRQAMLVKKIEYLREQKRLIEMTVPDFHMRSLIVADIVATIRRAGLELGGYPDIAGKVLPSREASGADSAIDAGGSPGC